MEAQRLILSLLELPGVGRKSARKILDVLTETPRTSGDLYHAVTDTGLLRKPITAEDAEAAWEHGDKVLVLAKELGIEVMPFNSPEFPPWISSIDDAPLVLFIKGQLDCVTAPKSVAIIGTREPTDYGGKVAHRFGQRAAEAGFVVVSGLALGCDTAGHQGCLHVSGRTIAVLAHGLDRIYPKESIPLADEILEKKGCWVSEYPPGTRAQRSYFVERDRLQSAMSGGVIVVETDTDGGSMHTVRFAESQRRPVGCLAHPADLGTNDKARGNQLLLREGRAKPLGTSQDLRDFFTEIQLSIASRGIENPTPAASSPPTAKTPESRTFTSLELYPEWE